MKIKQFVLSLLIVGILSLPTLLIISGGTSTPTFWNYEQHISKEKEMGLRDKLGFNTFGDLDQLEAAIYGNKVIAAISSDYQAAKFAKNNVIQKINFDELWGLQYENSAQLKTELKKIYTPFVFDALDQAFDLTPDYLWEYVVPYFIQEKVIAFDIRKGEWTNSEKEQLLTPEGTKELFPQKTYKGILKTLQNHGYKRIVINDYIRDNMMIGSEISGEKFNSLPTENTYKTQIDGFKQTIEDDDGFGQLVSSNNVKFDTDGTNVLQDLIDPSKKWDTAILYNGDALDAYNAQEQFPSLEETHFVRVVFPENPIFLIDTLIIPSYINNDGHEKLLDTVYEAINQNLFENANVTTLDDINLQEPPENYPILVNFNYVPYTLPYKIYDETIRTHYFKDEDGTDDNIAKDIYTLTSPSSDDVKNNFTQNVDDPLFTSMLFYYMLMKN